MYTIKEIADLMNLPTSTIRYYDKQGLLPFVERSDSGYRQFSDQGVQRLPHAGTRCGVLLQRLP